MADNPRAVVFGRYAGVVEVLSQLLAEAGIIVVARWAGDTGPGPPPEPPSESAVVVTVAPGDDTLIQVRARGYTQTVVAVTWHPDHELDNRTGPAVRVRAGQIRATLATVTKLVAQSPNRPQRAPPPR